LTLSVRLTPAASVDRIDGLVEDAAGVVGSRPGSGPWPRTTRPTVRLRHSRQAPENRKIAVRVISGDTSRTKTVRIDVDPEALVGRVRALAG
jgi:uncharacterized protein YggU (UPF0235/DUF167 family)